MLKGLIENECAGQNSLIKLGSHFNSANLSEQQQKLHQAAQQQQQHQQSSSSHHDSNAFLNEYLNGAQGAAAAVGGGVIGGGVIRAAPRSFLMDTLFNEIKQIDNNAGNKTTPTPTPTTNAASTWSSSAAANDWSQAYLSTIGPFAAAAAAAAVKQHQQQQQQQQQSVLPQSSSSSATPLAMDDRSLKWSTDYLTQSEATIFDDAWENMLFKNPLAAGLAVNNDNLIATNQLNDEMRKTANELLDSMQDSRFSETEFLDFVRELSVNALANSNNNGGSGNKLDLAKSPVTQGLSKLRAGSQLDASSGEKQTSGEGGSFDLEDDDAATSTGGDLAQEWAKEFAESSSLEKEANLNDYWSDLQTEWNTLATENPEHPWLDDFQKVFDVYKTYEFDAENPLSKHPRAFEEGLERLKAHDIVNAVLLFEAAVQAQPDNMLAWQYLGTTQVENEQDAQAIRALRRCLELKPDNLVALSTLATSYTNESMQRLAFDSLIKWMKHHPIYSSLLKNDEQAERLLAASDLLNKNAPTSPFYMAAFSVVHAGDFIDLQEIFLKAVRESSTSTSSKIDPDLQCCLGVLFHLSNEYDKAADCFKTALQVKPNDHLLWNKLGATYANNNRNEEAIDAYYQALKLCPGFVRARYNLGIGCMNLGAYKESVEHFLTALVQQSQACISGGENKSDESKTRPRLHSTTSSHQIQQMSETIWSTLRLALSYLNKSDLQAACAQKNLALLRHEFNI